MSSFSPILTAAIERFAQAVRQHPARFPEVKPRLFVVGGAVRDQLMGLEVTDADVEVYGIPADDLRQLIETTFPGQMIEVGKAFGVVKVPLEQGFELDIALPRTESKVAAGHQGFAVTSDPTLDPKEAARRRDFTINALMLDPLTNETLDFFGGRSDIDARLLRVVDATTFADDPLRVFRAMQFVARFELSVDPTSLELMRDMVSRGLLEELSAERITEEWRKLLLKAKRPSIGLELMHTLGMIERLYPELAVLEPTQQEHEWHPEGNVWIHTCMVVDQAAAIIRRANPAFTPREQLEVMIGSLCHDLGKPSTTKMGEKDGVPRLRSLGHEEAGVEPTRVFLGKLMFGDDILASVERVVADHLKAGMLYLQREKQTLTDEQYANAVRKLIKRLHPTSWRVFLAVCEADHRGRAFPDAATKPYAYGDLFTKTVVEQKLDAEPTKPLVQGRDVIERGIKPGPRVGEIIAAIEELRDRGDIKTREQALEVLGQLV